MSDAWRGAGVRRAKTQPKCGEARPVYQGRDRRTKTSSGVDWTGTAAASRPEVAPTKLRILLSVGSKRAKAKSAVAFVRRNLLPAGRCSQVKRLPSEVSSYIHCIYSDDGEMLMIVEFCRWGNSLAVRIPKAVADALKVSDGRRAEISVENGTLVLRPLLKPTRKPRYTLEELLSGMTKENVPQEVDWGPPRGNEAW